MTYNVEMFTFIETKLFTRLADELLSDDGLAALQRSLIERPEAGDVVPGHILGKIKGEIDG